MARSMPAGVSTAVRDLVDGPSRAAEVLGAFPTAVYVRTEPEGRLVAVVTSDALRLPCAAVLATPSAVVDLRAVAPPGSAAVVGGGRVGLAGLAVHPGHWWVPRVPRPWRSAPAVPRGAGHDVGLAGALATADLPAAARLAASLLGRGEGLTPEGDDVLAGLLVAGHAVPAAHPVAATARHVAELVRVLAPVRTTALSADLLAHAARGHGVPALLDLVDALGRGGGSESAAAMRRLLAVGHTSGAALARGCLTVVAAYSQPGTTSTSQVSSGATSTITAPNASSRL